MKSSLKKSILLISLLLLIILTTGCGSQDIYLCKDGSMAGDQQITSKNVVFHCADGKNTLNYNDCKFEKPLEITQKVAEEKAMAFVEGYTRSAGWSSKLVNSYSKDGNWYIQAIISKRDEVPFETIVLVNGSIGTVSCEENCEYQG
jgi:hypothetical protein